MSQCLQMMLMSFSRKQRERANDNTFDCKDDHARRKSKMIGTSTFEDGWNPRKRRNTLTNQQRENGIDVGAESKALPIGEVSETRDDQCKSKRNKQQSYLWVSTIQLFLSAASTRINDFDFYLFWFLLAAADGCLLSFALSLYPDQCIVLACRNESSSWRAESNSVKKREKRKNTTKQDQHPSSCLVMIGF